MKYTFKQLKLIHENFSINKINNDNNNNILIHPGNTSVKSETSKFDKMVDQAMTAIGIAGTSKLAKKLDSEPEKPTEVRSPTLEQQINEMNLYLSGGIITNSQGKKKDIKKPKKGNNSKSGKNESEGNEKSEKDNTNDN